MHAEAYDAFAPIFASASVLVFLNASAGAAAASAPSQACAEHKLACPWTPLYHPLGEPSCSKKHTKHWLPLSASTGLMPTMMDVYKRRAPQNERPSSDEGISAPHALRVQPSA